MEIGIAGLPNVGKSTLFNALTSQNVPADVFPFTTIEPNTGIAAVTDVRLDKLVEIFKPEKVRRAAIKFVDIAGLVKGAHTGQGLGNKFLSHIRDVNAVLQVVRAFKNDRVANSITGINPREEIEIIETEMILSDIEQLNNAREKFQGQARCGLKEAKIKSDILQKAYEVLNTGVPLRDAPGLDAQSLSEYNFLTFKKTLYVFNTDDDAPQTDPETGRFVREIKKSDFIMMNVQMEYELNRIDPSERGDFCREFRYETQIPEMVRMASRLLDLITFYTVVGTEVSAWSVPSGMGVRQAAGKIHSDMEKGFIKADVYGFSQIEKVGSEKALAEHGLIKTVGKEYAVQDGDIIKIKFQQG
ncbi:MAG: redox-regulated ATPase YchF [Elusimicrobiota bacterium]